MLRAVRGQVGINRDSLRTTKSGKKNGGSLAAFINNRWCNSGHITIKKQLCSSDSELLAVNSLTKCHVIMLAMYIPLSADVATAAK